MFDRTPKVSVVTIVRNDAEGLLATARSVLQQDYGNIEWIVVDGLSTDGTSDYVRSLAPRMANLRIEKDTGIYNAMNKGIEMLTGDWVFFMNAGDVFLDRNVVSTYVKNLSPTDCVVYSDVVGREDGKVHSYRPENEFYVGMICDHQSACVRADIYKELKYDESFKVAGDFDFLSRARIKGCSFRKLHGVLSARKPFSFGASTNYVDRQNERLRVIKKYFIDYPWRQILVQEYTAAHKTQAIDDKEYEMLMKLLGV